MVSGGERAGLFFVGALTLFAARCRLEDVSGWPWWGGPACVALSGRSGLFSVLFLVPGCAIGRLRQVRGELEVGES